MDLCMSTLMSSSWLVSPRCFRRQGLGVQLQFDHMYSSVVQVLPVDLFSIPGQQHPNHIHIRRVRVHPIHCYGSFSSLSTKKASVSLGWCPSTRHSRRQENRRGEGVFGTRFEQCGRLAWHRVDDICRRGGGLAR
jgi:hypothetical protein